MKPLVAAVLLFSTLAAADHQRRQVVVASGPLTVVDRDHLARKLSRIERLLTEGGSGEVRPISEQERRDLLQAMSEKWRPAEALELLAERAPSHWFLIAHVKRITDAIFAPSDKLKAVRILRPRILDPQNHEQLAKRLFSPSGQEEVRRILR